MRIRSIKPDFFKDDELAALPPLTRLLFIGLWCMADCEGRLEDRPPRIRAEVLPYDDCDIDALLGSLHSAEFIARYIVGSRGYVEVRSFKKHQRISGVEASRESEIPSSEHPEAVEKQGRSRVEAPEKRPRSNAEAAIAQEGKGMGREGKGTGYSSSRDDDFSVFWASYPRKVGKGAAAKKWKGLTSASRLCALSAVEVFATAWAGAQEDRKQFIPHPSTWLSEARWQDDPAEWKRQAGGRSQGPVAVKAPPVQIGAHSPAELKSRDLDDAPPDIQDIARRWVQREPTTDDEDRRLVAWEAGADAH